MEEVIREGKWKCPACGAGNRGRDQKCSGCGQARGEVEFELDEDAAAVTDGEQLAAANAGADWVCAYCSTSNAVAVAKCKQCGAGRDEGKQRKEQDAAIPEAGPRQPLAAPAEEHHLSRAAWTILSLCVLLGVTFFWLAFSSSEQRLLLKSAHWDRSIAVETLTPVQEDGWDVPSGGRVLSSSLEVHHLDRIPDGTRTVMQSYTERVQTGTKKVRVGRKNKGNGYFADLYEERPVYTSQQRTRPVIETIYRSVPVLRTKYHYEVDRWIRSRSVDTSGDDTAPKWGDFSPGAREREGPRSETFRVALEGGGKTYNWNPPASVFERLKAGETYKVEISGLGFVNRILD